MRSCISWVCLTTHLLVDFPLTFYILGHISYKYIIQTWLRWRPTDPRAGASSHQQLIHLIPWPVQNVTLSRWATVWTRGESSATLSLSHFLECPWCLFLLGAFSAPFCLLKYSSIYPHLQPHVHGIPSLCSARFFPSWLAVSFSFQLQS